MHYINNIVGRILCYTVHTLSEYQRYVRYLEYSKCFFTDCATSNFTITSENHGHVRHYSIDRYLYFLSKTLPPAYFCFTNNFALKELESGKCVSVKNDAYIELTNDCTEPWKYDPDKNQLSYNMSRRCFSPWKAPEILRPVAGLSHECRDWNKVVLKPSKYLLSLSQRSLKLV